MTIAWIDEKLARIKPTDQAAWFNGEDAVALLKLAKIGLERESRPLITPVGMMEHKGVVRDEDTKH